MSEHEPAKEVWPRAFQRMTNPLEIVVFRNRNDAVRLSYGRERDWYISYAYVAESPQWKSCAVPPFDHDASAETLATKYMHYGEQLRSDLAQARHDATSWQNVAEGMGEELRRLKETCEAQRKHVAALAAKLKAAGVRA